MTEQQERLIRCFRAVFPALSRDEVFVATVRNVPQWDSLAMVTLVALLEQEFALRIDPLDAAECDSFASVSAYLRERGALT